VALACAGATCLGVWRAGFYDCDDCFPNTAYVRGQRFSSAGALLGTQLALDSGAPDAPAVASNGTDFAVAWPAAAMTRISATRVRASDGTLDSTKSTLANAAHVLSPAAASNGSDWLFAFREDGVVAKVYGARFSSAAVVLDQPERLISTQTGPNQEVTPSVATDGTGYFAVWIDSRNGVSNPFGARIAADGTVLDTTAIQIAAGGANKPAAQVAFGGGVYLVAWADANGSAGAARVSSDGTLLDNPPLALPQDAYLGGAAQGAQVIFDGTQFLVAWTSVPGGPAYFETNVHGVRVAPDGTFGAGIDVTGRGGETYLTGLASDGNGQWLVAAASSGPYGSDETNVSVKKSDNTAVTSFKLGDGFLSVGAGFDGTRYLVVWADENNPVDLTAARVATDGTLLDPGGFALTTGAAGRVRQRVAFDGKSFVAVWEDRRLGPTSVFGARVDGTGTVRDPLGIEIASDPLAEGTPGIASAGGNRSLVVYARRHADNSLRVHARLLDDTDQSLPLGAACVTAGDCQSGFCADRVCCATACNDPCVTCNSAASPGTCVPAAQPQRGNRPRCTNDGTVCGGSCNGTDVTCVYPAAGIDCRAASCPSIYYAIPAATCDGMGTCPRTVTYCEPYACESGACATTCTTDADCASTNYYCGQGACLAKKMLAAACASADECQSGFCADGHCCMTACTGQCAQCATSQYGYCLPVTGAPVGGRAPCASDGSACAGSCTGSFLDCYFPANIPCGAKTCTAGILSTPSCDGKGACDPHNYACDPYQCASSQPACATSCTADSSCAADGWCSAGSCVKKLQTGACTRASQCASGFCVDGQCCDRECGGQCEACGLAGLEGICSPVTGPPVGGRAACAGSGPCAGACDGVRMASCSYPGASVECAPASCAGGMFAAATSCDGSGHCGLATHVACAAGCTDGGVCAPVPDGGAPPDLSPAPDDLAAAPADLAAGTPIVDAATAPDLGTVNHAGCGCRIGGASGPPPALVWLLALAGVGIVRRARSRR
jgi:MYXO-CTERM domain-containing protein